MILYVAIYSTHSGLTNYIYVKKKVKEKKYNNNNITIMYNNKCDTAC